MSAQSPTPDPETSRRLSELLLETNKRQLATADGLDSKAWQALGAGSIVLGLGVAGDLGRSALIIGLAIYAALTLSSLGCLMVRGYSVMPRGSELWKDYWHRPPDQLDHVLVDAMSSAESTNAKTLITKARLCRFAIGCLSVELAVVAVAAVIG